MRSVPLAIGICLVLISVPGYFYTPMFVSQMAHSMMSLGGSSSSGSSPVTTTSILHSMGYPSRSTISPIMQYSFIGLAVAGVGMTGFGAVAKKVKKQFAVKLVAEEPDKVKEFHAEPQPTNERTQTNFRSLKILQERLAKGEITSNEFQRLKRLLE